MNDFEIPGGEDMQNSPDNTSEEITTPNENTEGQSAPDTDFSQVASYFRESDSNESTDGYYDDAIIFDDTYEVDDSAQEPANAPLFTDSLQNNVPLQTSESTEPSQQIPVPPTESQSQQVQQPQQQYFNPYVAQPQQTQTNQMPPLGQQYPNAPFNAPYNQPVQTKKSKGKKFIFAFIAVCIVIAIAVIIGTSDSPAKVTTTTESNAANVVESIPSTTIANTQPSTTAINIEQVNSVWVAEKVRPSVVGVMTYQNGQLAGEGSGVLWGVDHTGQYTYVVTCAHVIDSKTPLSYGILMLDGTHYEAEMVASDAKTDIGVLKIKATGLPVAELGDSSVLKIGEPVYAIGNPGGSEYFGSITNGIVSAIDRSINATYTMTCIQHNAAINPGNSGGALVNTAGQIVGINSSKISSTDYEGMGFAVPMSIVKPVVEALIQYKYVPNRPKLGIEYATVSSYQLYSIVVSIKGLPQGSLVIAGISTDSSLANTDAQVGDLIIAVNDKPMDDSNVLLDLIDTGAVGDTLKLTLCRIEERTYKTTTFDVTITLVEDKGSSVQQEETTTQPGDYYYGGAESFEDYFERYFGFDW